MKHSWMGNGSTSDPVPIESTYRTYPSLGGTVIALRYPAAANFEDLGI